MVNKSEWIQIDEVDEETVEDDKETNRAMHLKEGCRCSKEKS